MKAVILCAGKGTRLYPVTLTMPKPLIPVANKKLVEYAIEMLVANGASEIALVVNSLDSPIREYLGDGNDTVGVPLQYIAQEERLGLAHAVDMTKEFVGDDPFFVYLGDNIFQDQMKTLCEQFESSGASAAIALTEVPNPSAFGIAELDGDRIKRLIEKPKDPPSNLAIAGLYMFQPDIFEAIEHIEPSWRNEYEITDAIQWLIEHDRLVIPYVVDGWWIDAGQPESIVLANQLVMEQLPYSEIALDDPRIQGDSSVGHRVILGESVQIIDSVIRGPAVIGDNTVIRNAYIGPYTSVANDVVIENSEIEDSIVMCCSVIKNIQGRIDSSLIADNTQVIHAEGKPKTHRFVLAENSTVQLS